MFLSTYSERRKFVKRLIFWSVVIGGLFALLFAQTIAHAQTTTIDPCDTLGGCVKGIDQYSNGTTRDNVTDFVLDTARFLIFIGAAIAVLFIVIGGYNMITSNGNPDQYKKGLNTLVYAVIGLVVSIVSVTIVYIVGTIITNFKLNV